MPSNQSPLGALPARFRRQRVLVIGCGDVGMRVARGLRGRVNLLALTSSPERRGELRAAGLKPLLGNLDQARTLGRLAGVAQRVLHLAAPPADGADWRTDPRTRVLMQALARRSKPQALVYGSTSGVYGDCAGEWVTETRAVSPGTPRAHRRADAESRIRHFGRAFGVRVGILRIPGIYGVDRVGGTPRSRLLRGTPVLQREDDVFTNHVEADDLARACMLALWRGGAQRVFNVCDDTELRMGDYFDLAADLMALPRPPRVSRGLATEQLPLGLLSFMRESRRLDGARIRRELRWQPRYPTVSEGLTRGK